MDVSIIFVNYKTKDLTINAIKSVRDKTNGIEYEIFVVDNNSSDGSIEAIETEFPNINIIKNPVNSGFGSANNLGIKQAKGKYILCLNTDTLLSNNAVKILFDFMESNENKDVGVCGGYILDNNNNPGQCGGRFPTLSTILWKFGLRDIFKNFYHKHFDTCIYSNEEFLYDKIDYIIGADLFVRKAVLEKTGVFDENIFMFFEETDLCKRIKDYGYKIKIVPNAKIIHLEGKSTTNQLKKKIWFKESELYYFRKHHPIKALAAKIIYTWLFLIDWLILKNSESQELLKLIWAKKIK